MKFYIAFAILAVASADVSHLSTNYLPPVQSAPLPNHHSGSAQIDKYLTPLQFEVRPTYEQFYPTQSFNYPADGGRYPGDGGYYPAQSIQHQNPAPAVQPIYSVPAVQPIYSVPIVQHPAPSFQQQIPASAFQPTYSVPAVSSNSISTSQSQSFSPSVGQSTGNGGTIYAPNGGYSYKK